MNATIIYFLGVFFLIIGAALVYVGSHLKATGDNKTLKAQVETLKEENIVLIKGKNLLIEHNKELASRIDQYKDDLEEKKEAINELRVKVTKKDYDISSGYDFFGAKRTKLRPGCIDVTLGPEFDVFNKMDALEKQKNYSALIKLCEKQIKKTPEWLTPYFYMGVAFANLGNKARAIKLFEHVLKNAPAGDEEYAQAKDYLKRLKE